MASFCTKCGAPIAGRFCTACGTAIEQAPASPSGGFAPASQPPAMQTAAPGGSGMKILLVVVGVVVMLGAIGVGGLVYVGYRAKQKIAELKQDYGVDPASGSRAGSAARVFPPAKGSGCRMLEGQEAAQVLGVAVDRAELDAHAPQGTEMCRYLVTAAERQRLMREEIAAGLMNTSKADGTPNTSSVEGIVGGGAGLLNEINGDNKNSDSAFTLQVWRSDGKTQWDKMETAQSSVQKGMGSDVANIALQSVDGVGDKAMVVAAGHSIMVLKGDAFFLLGFEQFVPGRAKTIALAKIVAGRV